eukprot:SAG31_NODE_10363_length_1148_cov_1.897045_1_plen_86_part_10
MAEPQPPQPPQPPHGPEDAGGRFTQSLLRALAGVGGRVDDFIATIGLEQAAGADGRPKPALLSAVAEFESGSVEAAGSAGFAEGGA